MLCSLFHATLQLPSYSFQFILPTDFYSIAIIYLLEHDIVLRLRRSKSFNFCRIRSNPLAPLKHFFASDEKREFGFMASDIRPEDPNCNGIMQIIFYNFGAYFDRKIHVL